MAYLLMRPTGKPAKQTAAVAKPRVDWRAARVGLLSNQKPNADKVLEELRRQISSRVGQDLTVRWFRKQIQSQPMPPALMQDILTSCDVVIHGVGD